MNKWKLLARALKCVFCVFAFLVFLTSALLSVVDVMHAETLRHAVSDTCLALFFGTLAFFYVLPFLGK